MSKILAKVGELTVTEAEVNEFIATLGQRGAAYNNPEGRKSGGFADDFRSNNVSFNLLQNNYHNYEPDNLCRLNHKEDKSARDCAYERTDKRNKIR